LRGDLAMMNPTIQMPTRLETELWQIAEKNELDALRACATCYAFQHMIHKPYISTTNEPELKQHLMRFEQYIQIDLGIELLVEQQANGWNIVWRPLNREK